jgi:hypothetical protein
MFWSSILRLMPPQLYERVDKWTHEPQSNFNHKKHLSNTFIHTFIFSINLFWKYKNIFTFLHTHTKPQNTFTTFYKLHISLVYLSRIIFNLLHFYLFYWISYLFYLHSHLVLDNHSMELGTQYKENCFVGCLKNDASFYDCSSRVRYKPRVFSWGKFTLATTLYTWSPNKLAPCLVSSRQSSSTIAREQRKAFTTASIIKRRQFSDARSSLCVVQSPKLGEVTPRWVFSFF